MPGPTWGRKPREIAAGQLQFTFPFAARNGERLAMQGKRPMTAKRRVQRSFATLRLSFGERLRDGVPRFTLCARTVMA